MHSSFDEQRDDREAFGSTCSLCEELRSKLVLVLGSKLVLVHKQVLVHSKLVLERKQELVQVHSKLVLERKQVQELRSKLVLEHRLEHMLVHKHQPCNDRTTCRSNRRPSWEPRWYRPKRTSQTKQSTSFLPPRG
ncbi:hypothetical protein [Rubripirellula reticaptiva]|uniref:Uncharacterized protein n=1 Tax=Rubripirellula reticaptiva TaxID=2528013 RepID=A0A5C6EI92_9BACT|nr:hypothetical protein [Rubripirellula reticaptiva]TWU48155.1 hypothetical protein Poly59_50010 [Rubripirellula reticaptiva]